MAGLYEIWRNKAVADEDEPGAFVWSATVITTSGRGLRRAHPRPDADARRAGALRPPGSTRRSTTPASSHRCWSRPLPAGSRPTRCPRRSTTYRNNGEPTWSLPLAPVDERPASPASCSTRDDRRQVRVIATDTATPACTPTAPANRSRRWCSATGPAGARTRPTWWRLAEALPRQGISVFRIEQPWHVAGKKVAARPGLLDDGHRSPASTRSASARRWSSAAAAPVRGWPAGWHRRSGRSAASRWRSRCTRRAGPRRPGCPSWSAPACRRSSCRGSATRSVGPTSSLTPSSSRSIPDADHGFAVPKRAALSQEETSRSSSRRSSSG